MEKVMDFLVEVFEGVWNRFKLNALIILCGSVAPMLLLSPFIIKKIPFISWPFILPRLILLAASFLVVHVCVLSVKEIKINKSTWRKVFENITAPAIYFSILTALFALFCVICSTPMIVSYFSPDIKDNAFVYILLISVPFIASFIAFIVAPNFFFTLFNVFDLMPAAEARKTAKELGNANKAKLYFLLGTLIFAAVILNLSYIGIIISFPLTFLSMKEAQRLLLNPRAEKIEEESVAARPLQKKKNIYAHHPSPSWQKKEAEIKQSAAKPKEKKKTIQIAEVCKIITVKLLPAGKLVNLLREKVADNEIKETKQTIFGKKLFEVREDAKTQKPPQTDISEEELLKKILQRKKAEEEKARLEAERIAEEKRLKEEAEKRKAEEEEHLAAEKRMQEEILRMAEEGNSGQSSDTEYSGGYGRGERPAQPTKTNFSKAFDYTSVPKPEEKPVHKEKKEEPQYKKEEVKYEETQSEKAAQPAAPVKTGFGGAFKINNNASADKPVAQPAAQTPPAEKKYVMTEKLAAVKPPEEKPVVKTASASEKPAQSQAAQPAAPVKTGFGGAFAFKINSSATAEKPAAAPAPEKKYVMRDTADAIKPPSEKTEIKKPGPASAPAAKKEVTAAVKEEADEEISISDFIDPVPKYKAAYKPKPEEEIVIEIETAPGPEIEIKKPAEEKPKVTKKPEPVVWEAPSESENYIENFGTLKRKAPKPPSGEK